MGMSAGSILRTSVAGVSLLAHIFLLLRALWKAPVRKLIRDAGAAAAGGWRFFVGPPKARRSEIDAVVDEKMERLTLERALHFHQIGCLLFLLLCPIELHRKLSTGRDGEFSEEQATCGFACYAIMLVAQVPAIACRMRVLKTFSAAIWLFFVVTTSPWAAMPELVQTPLFIAFVDLGIMLCNIGMPSPMVSGIGTVCCVVSLSSCYYVHMPETALSLSAFQVAVGIASVCLASVLRTSMYNQTRATVHAEATRVAHEAACALLMSFCDVVVDLDSAGRILGDGGSIISGFLLQGRSLQGAHIQDLVSDADGRASLLEKLRAPRRDGGSLADLIHVRMRDGNGTALPMQLFWFAYNGVDGQFRCMVGLRKFADGDPTERAAEREQGAAPADKPAEDELGDHEVCVVVDTSDPNLPVEFQSPGFGMNIFRLPHGARLCDYLENGDTFGFWLQRVLNRQLIRLARQQGAAGEPPPQQQQQQQQQQLPWEQQPPREQPEQQKPQVLQEQPEQQLQTKVCFRTRAGRVYATAILVTQPEAVPDTGEPLHALLLFKDIQRKHVFVEQRGRIEIDRLSKSSSGRSCGNAGGSARREARSRASDGARRTGAGSSARGGEEGGRPQLRSSSRVASGRGQQPAPEVSPCDDGIQFRATAQL